LRFFSFFVAESVAERIESKVYTPYTDDDIRKEMDATLAQIVEIMFGTNLLQKGAFFSVESYLDIPIAEILFLANVSESMAGKLRVEVDKEVNRKPSR